MSATCLKCKIAELKVGLSILFPNNRLIPQSEEYLDDFDNAPDFEIKFTKDFLEKRVNENIQLPIEEAEYIWTGYEFCRKLLDFGGLIFPASAVEYKGKAYLFSAPSGTGKSTHTSIWKKVFGDDAVIINDDKPALRLKNGKIFVYGTPWSGKSDINTNISVPLGGICFLSRGNENLIEKADIKSAASLILSQTLRYPSSDFMDKLLGFLDKHLDNIPVFRMKCNIDDDAAKTAYEFMNKYCEGEKFYEN